MKKIIIIFTIGFSIKSFSQIPSSYCSPTMKEIYDFSIGQVFQYNNGCNNCYVTKYYYTNQNITSKYAITSKSQIGDSLIYHIKGLKKVININVADIFNPVYDSTILYSEINMDTIFIDSKNYILNKCDGDTIIYTFGTGKLSIISDSIKEIDVSNLPIKSKFGKGLGLIKDTFAGIQNYQSCHWTTLEGYIINGIEFGKITPDKEFTNINSIKQNKNEIDFYIIDKNKYGLTSKTDIVKYSIYNMNGQLIKDEYVQSQNAILNIDNFQSGYYILRAISNNYIFVKKIVKF